MDTAGRVGASWKHRGPKTCRPPTRPEKGVRPCTHLRSRHPDPPASVSSGQTVLQHTQGHSYRCYLPVLTGFGSLALRRIQPSTPLLAVRPEKARTSRREFDPAVADCGFRAPLSPHLARPYTESPGARHAWTPRTAACGGSRRVNMVEQMGIEPTTSRLRTWRSPN